MLAFSMPRLLSPILDRNRFTRQADRCHSLSTSHKPVLSPLCFHGLTNCFSRKPFTLRNICVAPRVSPPRPPELGHSDLQTNQVFHIHTVANSLWSPKKSCVLESATSGTLLRKHPGWGWVCGACGINQ